MNKTRIAFIKYCGLSSGGTEKFLQTVAANLDKEKYAVDYYYTEPVPFIGATYKHAGTSIERKRYLEEHGVNLIEVKLTAVDLTKRTYPWVDTDFFEKFNELNYNLIQTGRGGYPEFPFTKIRTTPIVDSLHLLAGVDNQYNIARVMHITEWSRALWEQKGGDRTRSVVISHPIEMSGIPSDSLRSDLNLEEKLVFGFHQRNDSSIFSPIPLKAYSRIESDDTHFILLGGSEQHRTQARDLHIKNISFLEHTTVSTDIYRFLKTLDIYTHGRADGEVNSTAIAEALYFGCPIVSHVSPFNNGHIECIKDAGYVAEDLEDYTKSLQQLKEDPSYRKRLSQNALRRFNEMYELNGQMRYIESIYEQVLRDPFPHPLRRTLSTLRLRRFFVYFPKKLIQLALTKLRTTSHVS